MAALNIELPDLKDTDFSDARQVKKLRDYMYVLTEQLRFVLANLDGENLSGEMNETIVRSAQQSIEAVCGVEECRSAIRQTQDGISMSVTRGELISEINQSPEAIRIQADKIALEGMVTANENFKIGLDGSMEAVNGRFSGSIDASSGSLGAFSVDGSGNLAGAATLQVGGITFEGNAAAGLKLTADNLSYYYGKPANSEAAYMLGVTDTGTLCLFDLYLEDGALKIAAPGSVPQSSAQNVIRITAKGDGLAKRAQMSTDAATLGNCSTGEVYGYTRLSTDAAGYRWAFCASRYAYDSATKLWTATTVSPFYVREYNNALTQNYFDLTTVNV